MSQPEDRLVYVCGCGGSACIESNIGWRSWSVGNVGRECPACNQPVTAINIDRLLRIEYVTAPALRAWARDINPGCNCGVCKGCRSRAAMDSNGGENDE